MITKCLIAKLRRVKGMNYHKALQALKEALIEHASAKLARRVK
jgi:hypothetical protein